MLCLSRTGMAPSRNFSSHSDLSQLAVGAPEPIKVQVFVKGRLEQSQGKWSYKGGKRLFQSVPVGYGYADLMYKMCEKLASDISMKYLAPGEELSPDNLISVSDDDDVQEMFQEYWRGLQLPDTSHSFRLTLMLFDALDDALDPDEYEDAEAAWISTSAEKAAREQGLSQSNSRAVTADYNSLSSDRSSVNSAAAGMRIASPYDASVWVQPNDTILEDIAGNELDAQDASYAFEQLKTIKQKPGKPAFQAYVKAGYEASEHNGKDRYSYGAKDGYGKDGYNKEGYNKDGYGQGQDQRYHTQADSDGEEVSGRSFVMKDRDPVSVLPSHLYSTDDEKSTQHAISASNSAQTQPNTSMHMSGKAASLHLPSISDIYAVIGENQKAGAMPQDPLNDVSACDNGGSIHYQEYEPRNLASAAPPQDRTPEGIKPGLKPGNSTSPTRIFGQQNGGFGQQDAYFTADSGFVNQACPQQAAVFPPARRLPGARQDRLRGHTALSSTLPLNLVPNPHATPIPHLPPYFHPPPFSAHPNLDGYLNVSPPYVPVYANPEASSNPYAKYLPYAGEGMDLGQMLVNGNKQFGVGARGVRDGQGPWGKPDKVTPAAQLLREHSGLTLASSGGSGTLNNPVHKVPKDEVKILRRIGEGAFGEVSLATCAIFGSVAVKWLKPGKVERHSQSFWREAEMLSNLNHPNVLRFYGVVVESYAEPNVIGIMTEYMKGGSLAAFLRTEGWLDLKCRAEMALSAVNGLAYLHEMSIVHFDLKPDNLLLDGKLQPGYDGSVPSLKVADFGLSKQKWGREFVSGVRDLRGTLPYMAPELVSDPERVSEKADVWSLGMVLWEMLTRQVPFTHLTPQQIIAGLMVGNLQPEVPDWCEQEWRLAMESCWEVNPDHRPSLRDLARRLEFIIEHAVL
ncbi:MAG: kinase family [Trebouxia sp. A1-2]|nr:MAG: kinase family [Trebouxia sp. A1-2]